jgi:hypothetical protein
MIHPRAGQAIDQAAKLAAFVHWFGLRPSEASVLVQLVDAKGEHVIPSKLAEACAAKPTGLQARICRLREALHTEAIDYELGRGYRLTEIGMTEAQGALIMMAGSLVR